MSKKLTVTIGIPAHNEEQNIGRLLDSILSQNSPNFILNKVIVACDGCADNTEKIARTYEKKHHLIEVISDGKQVGQAARLNQFYKLNKSDVFITFDGDTFLSNTHVINHLVGHFANSEVGLVGGRDTPAQPRNFLEQILRFNFELWYAIRKNINGGDSIHNHHGPVSAVSHKVTKLISYPSGMAANDEFLYIAVKKIGLKFKFEKRAVVTFRLPCLLKDYLGQYSRYSKTRNQLISYFGPQINKLYEYPKKLKIKAILSALLTNPVLLLLGVTLMKFAELVSVVSHENYSNGIWEDITSSKG